MPRRIPRFEKGQALSHRDLNALSEAISEQERGEWQRGRRRRIAGFICKTVAAGPGGEPDFEDSRYWVRQVRLETENPPGVAPTGMAEIQFGTSTPLWAEAINLSEVESMQHGLAFGTIVRIFEIRDSGGKTHFVFIPGGGGGGGGVEDVKIAYVVNCIFGDCDAEEQGHFDTIAVLTAGDGRHLKTFPVDINGVPQVAGPYLPTLPNTGHSIDEFLPVAWNIDSPTQTSFLAIANDGVWRMASFGEGERWVAPPTNVCGDEPGATGACCVGANCTPDQTVAECVALDGVYQGDGTTCMPDPCGGTPVGACCLDAGECAVQSESDCLGNGGFWLGQATNCSPNPCLFGACCNPGDGSCEMTLASDCPEPPLIYLGAGSSCTPNPCEKITTGACCREDGSCDDVEGLPECDDFPDNSTYSGDGTTCASTVCPPAGLCCNVDFGWCWIGTESGCNAPGIWTPEGTCEKDCACGPPECG